jgi:predicted acylesterase/phospholipase RssA
MEETGIIRQIKSITGCSAGSIFAVLLALKYTSVELTDVITKLKLADYVSINADSILNFTTNKGLDNGFKLMGLIKKLISDKAGNPDITFKELYNIYGVQIQICATNVNTMTMGLFNKDSVPDMPIHIAIRASTALPFVYEPVILDGHIYCDGGVINNMPMCIACLEPNQTSLSTSSQSDGNNNKSVMTSSSSSSHTRKLTQQFNTLIIDKSDTHLPLQKNISKPHKSNGGISSGSGSSSDFSNNISTSALEKTLGFYLTNEYMPIDKDTPIKDITLTKFIDRIFQTYGNLKMNTIKKYNKNIIVLEVPIDIMSIVKINATPDDIMKTIDIAYQKVKSQMEQNKWI